MKFTIKDDKLVKFELKEDKDSGMVVVLADGIEMLSFDNDTGELLHWPFNKQQEKHLTDKGFKLTKSGHLKINFYDEYGESV